MTVANYDYDYDYQVIAVNDGLTGFRWIEDDLHFKF